MKSHVAKTVCVCIALAFAVTANGCEIFERTERTFVHNVSSHPISVSVVASYGSENDSPQYALPGEEATVTIICGWSDDTSGKTVYVLDLTTSRLYSNDWGGTYPDSFLDPW